MAEKNGRIFKINLLKALGINGFIKHIMSLSDDYPTVIATDGQDAHLAPGEYYVFAFALKRLALTKLDPILIVVKECGQVLRYANVKGIPVEFEPMRFRLDFSEILKEKVHEMQVYNLRENWKHQNFKDGLTCLPAGLYCVKTSISAYFGFGRKERIFLAIVQEDGDVLIRTDIKGTPYISAA